MKEQVWSCEEASKLSFHPVDAIWVRKWKFVVLDNGTKVRIVKSRLCARGFLDSQNQEITTRATTASRLSQRLLVALSAIFGFELETWDISGAFLKGFPFDEVQALLRKKGSRSTAS